MGETPGSGQGLEREPIVDQWPKEGDVGRVAGEMGAEADELYGQSPGQGPERPAVEHRQPPDLDIERQWKMLGY